jgi:hypothetical protein
MFLKFCYLLREGLILMVLAVVSGNLPGVSVNIRKCISRFSCIHSSCSATGEKKFRKKIGLMYIYIFLKTLDAALTSNDCNGANDKERCVVHQGSDV